MARTKRRRPKGQGGIRKQRGRYSPYLVAAGETIRPGRSFATKAEAEGWLAAARLKHERCKAGADATLFDAVRDWIDGKNDVKPSTIYRYRQTFDKAESHLRELPLVECSPATLEKWLYALPFTEADREKTCGIVNQSLDRLVRLELLDRNPMASVRRPSPKRKKPAPYSKEQVQTLLAAIVGDELRSLYLVLLTAGIRPGEAFALDWEHVDFDRQAINVTGTLSDFGATHEVSETPKTASGRRWIKLTQLAWEALEIHAADGNRIGAVWKTTRGRRFRKSNFYRRQWRPLLEKAGLPYRRPYELRHSFATLSLLHGVPLRVVSSMLGHASPEITMAVYSHVFDDTQSEFIERIDAIFAQGAEHSVADNVPEGEAVATQTEAA